MGPVNPSAHKQHLVLCQKPTAFVRGGANTTHLEHKRPSQRSRGNHSERHRGADPPPRNTSEAAKDVWLCF